MAGGVAFVSIGVRVGSLRGPLGGSEGGRGPGLDHLVEASMLISMIVLLAGWKQKKWERPLGSV
ncbi:hypothetical protein SNOG_07371 [Parastagonospora nodorum SN15]|uniref:Uncharacterized protein n=1 Tax=Phaeosphaeria nodorum (strain SN15 / ATCC MYA-4574 / FGSC 10173) TaxID=321614 RepID=Q0ULJ3_PHANO|nr:hypothetical protein SNOG_07371 [Parastagonospora nodorum SN15]EAT84837.1 hypothetical protein SNOG_07371 [Parastagonospora nodorum SN15]